MGTPSTTWRIIEPGNLDYLEALNLQRRIVQAKIDDRKLDDIILFLEHPSVFTLGRRGGLEHLTVTEDFLKKRSVSIVTTERGGNITYHGPGQLVVYPMIDLAGDSISVLSYVEKLETVMLNTLAHWGLEGHRRPSYRGVWLDNAKIGSIGVAIRKSVCFHGFALNVNLSLEPFHWINPCGLENVTMTSMQHVLGKPVTMTSVAANVKRSICKVFGVRIEPLSFQALISMLNVKKEVA